MKAALNLSTPQSELFTSLFLVCEVGTSGKRAIQAFLNRSSAEVFISGKSQHLFKLEKCSAPDGYAPPMELFAAHTYDADYRIHRFAGLYISNQEATRVAGNEGLVVTIVPEE